MGGELDGAVVAPLPDGVTLEVGPLGTLVWDDYVGQRLALGGSAAYKAARVRVMHDRGDLDDYRHRCEAAAWRTFVSTDPETWPETAGNVLVKDGQGKLRSMRWRPETDEGSGGRRWAVLGVTHWRPMPAGPA